MENERHAYIPRSCVNSREPYGCLRLLEAWLNSEFNGCRVLENLKHRLDRIKLDFERYINIDDDTCREDVLDAIKRHTNTLGGIANTIDAH